MNATRVAPSPTGEAHVGTAYVALLNRLQARAQGGPFILRVEDTDAGRTVPGAEKRLLDALDWLGLSPDEGPVQGGASGPYRQSERLALYRQAAWDLVDAGFAYPAFEAPEEAAEYTSRGEALPSRSLDPGQAREMARTQPHVIRFRAPTEGEITVPDLLRGDVVFAAASVNDKVLLKSDGWPTYHLAATYDDRVMGVSTVLRAEEWLSSAALHLLLHQAMQQCGVPGVTPRFGHLPLLRNPDGSKISKRMSPTSLDWYRREGILPEALLEFLATMAWSGAQERRLNEFEAHFNLSELHTGAPVFDLERLRAHNALRLRELSEDDLRAALRSWSAHTGHPVQDLISRSGLQALSARAQTLADVAALGEQLTSVTPRAPTALSQAAHAALLAHADPSPSLKALAAQAGLKPGALYMGLRERLWGQAQGPGLDELRRLLSPEELTARLGPASAPSGPLAPEI